MDGGSWRLISVVLFFYLTSINRHEIIHLCRTFYLRSISQQELIHLCRTCYLSSIRWREMSSVIYDKKVPEVLKNKIHKTANRPAMTYRGECWAIRKCEQNQINTT